ncbi:hypothetical protein Pta02_33910 [Planobispora takensis]|uniref:Uncharacterized protein n=1 Tax=Planobispora takensis TaxID=1367882 RepID=A0A8J3SZ52_9ACTN|nr:hypothetical protein Pta02_33910 [Planobispora takensis]
MRRGPPGCANTPAAGHPNKAPALSGLTTPRIGAATVRNRAMSVNTEITGPPGRVEGSTEPAPGPDAGAAR